ncbi:MAG TPA: glutamine-hydrolyzing GMP synthase [Myxococcota bacterium]|nr:glutamine-hydrolyzing GMP synthase [Myxococcota bacterium]
MSVHSVLILDYGSQYTQLIARKVRELGVYCEIHPFHRPLPDLLAHAPNAVILSGGPASVDEPNAPTLPAGLLETGLPILGICYGCQLLAHTLGGRVARSDSREFGRATLTKAGPSRLLGRLGDAPTTVWMSHSDRIEQTPEGFSVIARTDSGVMAAMEHREKNVFGLQLHPEVHHTADGKAILSAFLFDIAGLSADWSPERFITTTLARIEAQVGDGHVICGLSGGVDSAVAAALVHKAISIASLSTRGSCGTARPTTS